MSTPTPETVVDNVDDIPGAEAQSTNGNGCHQADAAGDSTEGRKRKTRTKAKASADQPEPCPEDDPVYEAQRKIIDELIPPPRDENGKILVNQTRQVPARLAPMLFERILPIRYNLLSNRIENDGEPIHGDFLDGLYLDLAEMFNLEIPKYVAIDAARKVARRNAFHPVQDYLNSLEAGGIRLEDEDWDRLAQRCFGVEDPLASLHLRRQLIGAVARALQPGCKVDTALVLQGPQGVFKSSFWSVLGGEWFCDSLGELSHMKDDLQTLHSAWIHEWGEIDLVMGKKESEALKRFMSAKEDTFRVPYGRSPETFKRSSVLVGTTNRDDFVKDPTGNRRFPIIQVAQIDLEWVTAHRDEIWGSAVAAYRAGEPWWYDKEEARQVSEHARRFAQEDALLERVEDWLEEHQLLSEVPSARLVHELDLADQDDQRLRNRLSNCFRTLGWTRNREKRRYPFTTKERGMPLSALGSGCRVDSGDRLLTDRTFGWVRPGREPLLAHQIVEEFDADIRAASEAACERQRERDRQRQQQKEEEARQRCARQGQDNPA